MGIFVRATVYPESKREGVERHAKNLLTVRVKAPAERNLANKRMIELLAKEFKIKHRMIKIISGHQARRKMLRIEGIEEKDLKKPEKGKDDVNDLPILQF